MKPVYQGYPFTTVVGDCCCVSLWFRDPDWVARRGKLWKFGNLGLLIYTAYLYLTGQIHPHQLESVGVMVVSGSASWWAFLNLICWRFRSVCFTPVQIIVKKGQSLFQRYYNRMLPHGFRIQAYGRHEGYHLFMDHLEETLWLGDVYGHKNAEMITRRLINVSEWMSREFPNRDVEEVDEFTRQRRSTFARG
jgi:hypothetical protein